MFIDAEGFKGIFVNRFLLKPKLYIDGYIFIAMYFKVTQIFSTYESDATTSYSSASSTTSSNSTKSTDSQQNSCTSKLKYWTSRCFRSREGNNFNNICFLNDRILFILGCTYHASIAII